MRAQGQCKRGEEEIKHLSCRPQQLPEPSLTKLLFYMVEFPSHINDDGEVLFYFYIVDVKPLQFVMYE